MERIAHMFVLSRPLHLLGGWLFSSLGAAAALAAGSAISWPRLLWGMVVVTALQLMTHYSNDYFDLDADLANQSFTPWSGGSRVLTAQKVAPSVALRAALICGALGGLGGLFLALTGPAPYATLALLGLALALSWGYSAPPLWLNRRGLGEISGSLVLIGLTFLFSYQLQAGALGSLPLLIAVPLLPMQFAMLLAMNLPDAEGDRAAGKYTLVVRLGVARAALLYSGALLTAYASLPLLVLGGLPLAVAGLLLLGLPLAGWLGALAMRGAWHEMIGFWSIGLLMSSGALALAGLTIEHVLAQ
jgi:1,4-dihydroxy-2-naphthoate polyprenyltransferase